jgi:hypothetical protein
MIIPHRTCWQASVLLLAGTRVCDGSSLLVIGFEQLFGSPMFCSGRCDRRSNNHQEKPGEWFKPTGRKPNG